MGLSLFASSFEVIAHCERPLLWPWPLREHGCIWALTHSHVTAVLSTNKVCRVVFIYIYIFIIWTLNYNGLSAPLNAGSIMLLSRPLIFLFWFFFVCLVLQWDFIFFLICQNQSLNVCTLVLSRLSLRDVCKIRCRCNNVLKYSIRPRVKHDWDIDVTHSEKLICINHYSYT